MQRGQTTRMMLVLLGFAALVLATAAKGKSCQPAPSKVVVGQGEDCSSPDVVCDEGLTCVSYYGIAGPSGPEFMSCEIPCTGDADCPSGQICGIVADGPGQVCMPNPQAGEKCGDTTCPPGESCCNASCGMCAPPGVACIQVACEPCGNTICPPGKVCCNASCGICTPPDGFCTQQVCAGGSIQ